MSVDTSPGSPDGPPLVRPPSLAQRLGGIVGGAAILLSIVFVLVGMAWGIAWMVTHFPGT